MTHPGASKGPPLPRPLLKTPNAGTPSQALPGRHPRHGKLIPSVCLSVCLIDLIEIGFVSQQPANEEFY